MAASRSNGRSTRLPAFLVMAALLCSSMLPAAEAKQYNINWVHGYEIKNFNACVGDSIVFKWGPGVGHDLIETPTRSCSRAGGITLAGVSASGNKKVYLTKKGTRHFMCSVGLHCVLRQIVSVTVKKC